MIYVQEQDECFEVTYEDMVCYHGREFIGGVAMGYKLLELAASLIGDGVIVRKDFSMTSAVMGPGIIDAVELATRARSRGVLHVDERLAQQVDAVDAADGQGGKYYFEIFRQDRRMRVWLREGLVPEEFLILARKTHDKSISEKELERLQELKEEIAFFLMRKSGEEIFRYEVD